MELQAFLEHLNSGKPVEGGSEAHLCMHGVSQEALRITARINGSYHEPEQLRALCSILQEQADALYTYSELDYGMKRKVKPVYTGPDTEYKMTVRVPMEVIGDPVAFKARLKDQGYASISQWICREVQRINSIYKKKGSGTVDAATRPNDIIRSNNMRKKVNYIITRRATKVKEGHK